MEKEIKELIDKKLKKMRELEQTIEEQKDAKEKIKLNKKEIEAIDMLLREKLEDYK